MQLGDVVDSANTKLANAVTHFKEELNKLRTGRAHPSMLEGVMVEAYGTPMPLIQLATISTPEPQLIQVSPFDPGNIEVITSAIRSNQTLGLNPIDDGRVIRVPVPPLTEERRKEISKQVGIKLEECMISMRNIRHESLSFIDKSKKDKTIGEDEAKRLSQQVDQAMSSAKSDAESVAKSKESEILNL